MQFDWEAPAEGTYSRSGDIAAAADVLAAAEDW